MCAVTTPGVVVHACPGRDDFFSRLPLGVVFVKWTEQLIAEVPHTYGAPNTNAIFVCRCRRLSMIWMTFAIFLMTGDPNTCRLTQ
jgi:hypothetical protein